MVQGTHKCTINECNYEDQVISRLMPSSSLSARRSRHHAMSRRDGDGWALGEESRKTPPTRAAVAHQNPIAPSRPCYKGRSEVASLMSQHRKPAAVVHEKKLPYHFSGPAADNQHVRRGAKHDVDMSPSTRLKRHAALVHGILAREGDPKLQGQG